MLVYIFCLVGTVSGGFFDSVELDPFSADEATTAPSEFFAGIVLDPILKVDEFTSVEGPAVTITTTLVPPIAQGQLGPPVDWAAIDRKITALLVITSLLLVAGIALICLIGGGIARWKTEQGYDQDSEPKHTETMASKTLQGECASEESLDAIV
ncbi:hypothetical protein FOL47_010199 [Perkinsus chesapeaki]|uniref:Uncharacterized protein n=1 Tax=Perkinsus chesapeaki TaxID=330153 RepID=A0A7J6MQ36_PERCH|nr:hypothetical protein FOL47_010199 [Perkinsus chesapeaki]